MIPHYTPETTGVLVTNKFPYEGLPVTAKMLQFDNGEDVPCFVSYWRPSHSELELLLHGGAVILTLPANAEPPIYVNVVKVKKIKKVVT